jgi:hypothetical protein
VCRGRVLAVDLDRTRVDVLGGIGISLIGDFRSIEPLHNEIAIRDFPIEYWTVHYARRVSGDPEGKLGYLP